MEAVIAGAILTVSGETAVPILLRQTTSTQRKKAYQYLNAAEQIVQYQDSIIQPDELDTSIINEAVSL